MKEKKIKSAKKSKKSPSVFIGDDFSNDRFQKDHKLLEKKKAKKHRFDFPEYYY